MPTKAFSKLSVTLRIGVVIAVIETAIMFLFRYAPVPEVVEPFVDAGLLTLLAAPILYYWLISPLDHRLGMLIESLNDARELAQQANTAKTQFLANMSHEIRTPLAAVLGFAELLQQGVDDGNPDKRREFLDTIQSNARHLGQLLESVLDLAKVETGESEVRREPVDPLDVLQQTLNVFRTQALRRGLTLDCEFRGMIPRTIQTDPVRLRQVLANLLENAIKFTPRGGVTVHVWLENQSLGAHLVFEVCDTGVGIPAEKLQDIFEPFTQSDGSLTRKQGGAGLGLALCRRLAESLGGSVTAESDVGRGSKFIASFDVGPVDRLEWRFFQDSAASGSQAGNPHEESSASIPGREPRPVSPQPLCGVRVLVVDDGEANRRLAVHVLQLAGATVQEADNGLSAIELQDRKPFDLIVMDMMMPVMDGLEATRLIRSRGHQTPILALTAFSMPEDEKKCLAAGCNSYASKPLDRQQLIASAVTALSAVNPAAAASASPVLSS